MVPDLKQFDGMSFTTAVRSLREQGYDFVSSRLDSVTLAKPGEDFVPRLTVFTEQAKAFLRLCEENADNEYFPKIFAARHNAGNPGLSIIAMERLLTLDDIAPARKSILGGYARALATLIKGHETHDEVHAMMAQKENIAAAVNAILTMVEKSIESGSDTCIYYDQGFSENGGLTIDEWLPDHVLFRARNDGKNDLVFVEPFREGFVKDEADREELRQDIRALRERFKILSQKSESPVILQPGFQPKIQ